MPLENVSPASTPVSDDLYGQKFNEQEEIDFWDSSSLKQISVQKYCFNTMTYLLDYICDKPTFNDDKMKLNRKQVFWFFPCFIHYFY